MKLPLLSGDGICAITFLPARADRSQAAVFALVFVPVFAAISGDQKTALAPQRAGLKLACGTNAMTAHGGVMTMTSPSSSHCSFGLILTSGHAVRAHLITR
jgi:hypothetical protein